MEPIDTDELATDVPQTIDPDTDDEALKSAAATALLAEEDPLAMAAMNAQLRSSIRGAHALIHALMLRLASPGTTIVIERAQWQAPDPQLTLDIKTKQDGSVELKVVRKLNLAIRPKAKR